MKKYYCLGAKWFDKVNGNTYNNAKIMDENGQVVLYTGFQYGYGSSYFYTAKSKLEEIDPDGVLIDLGSANYKKTILKNNLF
jgi:spore coat polysaccharide biosynthesis predicted glycosyltransferase SpsG